MRLILEASFTPAAILCPQRLPFPHRALHAGCCVPGRVCLDLDKRRRPGVARPTQLPRRLRVVHVCRPAPRTLLRQLFLRGDHRWHSLPWALAAVLQRVVGVHVRGAGKHRSCGAAPPVWTLAGAQLGRHRGTQRAPGSGRCAVPAAGSGAEVLQALDCAVAGWLCQVSRPHHTTS